MNVAGIHRAFEDSLLSESIIYPSSKRGEGKIRSKGD